VLQNRAGVGRMRRYAGKLDSILPDPVCPAPWPALTERFYERRRAGWHARNSCRARAGQYTGPIRKGKEPSPDSFAEIIDDPEPDVAGAGAASYVCHRGCGPRCYT